MFEKFGNLHRMWCHLSGVPDFHIIFNKIVNKAFKGSSEMLGTFPLLMKPFRFYNVTVIRSVNSKNRYHVSRNT